MKLQFRKEQEEILKYEKGIMAISAVPGSGKTFILVHLSKKILETNLNKNKKILIITYMNSAVSNFENRISPELSRELLKNFEVKTIHKLAQDIIRENLSLLSLSEDYTILSSIEKFTILSNLCRNYFTREKDKFYFLMEKNKINQESIKDLLNLFTKSINNSISNFKMNDINYIRLFNETRKYKADSLLPHAASIYKEYQEAINQKGALDYDDLLLFAYKILKENIDIREKYQNKYEFILEDEAQDSNSLQNKIIALLIEKNRNLIKVGDSNQAIMGSFTSASPILFRNFIKKAPIVREIADSGRSSREIVKLANYFHYNISKKHPCVEARNALSKPYINSIKTSERNTSTLTQIVSKNEYEEINHLVYFIKEFIKKYPDKIIGILLPRNNLISIISLKLHKEKIDFSNLGEMSIQSITVLKKLSDILLLVSKPYEKKLFINIFKDYFLSSESKIDKKLENFIKNIETEKLIYEEILFPDHIKESKDFESFGFFIFTIKKLLDFSFNSNEKLLVYIGDLFNFNIEEKSLIEHIALQSKKVFKLNPKWTLEDLSKELKKSENNRFGFFASIISKEKDKEKKITITNYHKSKGQEWDFVYLFGINSFYFPVYLSQDFYGNKMYLKENYRNIDALINYETNKFLRKKTELDFKNKSQIEKISESIRLIFVGITRAKEFLLISNNREKDDFYIPLFKTILERIKNE